MNFHTCPELDRLLLMANSPEVSDRALRMMILSRVFADRELTETDVRRGQEIAEIIAAEQS